jgi:hypothetical protein
MENLKAVGVTVCTIAGLVTAIASAIHGSFWGAADLLLGGGIAAATCLLGWNAARNSYWGFFALILFTGIGWKAWIADNPGIDPERQVVEVTAALDLMQNSGQPWASPELRQMADLAEPVCFVQGGAKDMADATENMAKTIYLGPGTSVADAALEMTQPKSNKMDCLSMIHTLYAANPALFADLSIEHKAWLRKNGFDA